MATSIQTIQYGTETQGSIRVGSSGPLEYPSAPTTRESGMTHVYKSDTTQNRLVNDWRNPSAYRRELVQFSNWQGLAAYWTGWGEYATAYSGCTQIILPAVDRYCPTATPQMLAKAETNCLLRIRDQKMDFAVSVAEITKTIDMVRDRVMTLFEAYRQAKRGRFRAAARKLGVSDRKGKRQAKSWLELQYGWMPLLYDIKGAYDFLSSFDEFKVSAKYTTYQKLTDPPVYPTQYGLTAIAKKYSGQYGVKVRLDYVLSSAELKKAAELGLDNPASVAWELVPFSFVVDWVVPVGDWLAALSATTGLTFKGGSRTYFGLMAAEYQSRSSPQPPWFPWSLGGKSKATAYHRYMDRQIYTSTPIPALRYNNPFNGSATRALNAIALLRSLV